MTKTITIAFACLLLAACRYREAETPAPGVNKFSVGEKFRITLPENHERKESWSLIENHNRSAITRLNDVWHGNEKGIDFNFQAVTSGSAQLNFVKRIYGDTVESVKYLVEITDN